MTDQARALLEKHPHLHWTEAAALARLIGLVHVMQTEIAERFPACQSPDLLPALMQLLGQIVVNRKEI